MMFVAGQKVMCIDGSVLKVTQMAPILSPALPRPARLGAGLIARPMRVVRMSHVVQAAGR